MNIKDNPKRILIVKPSSLGDVIQSLPLAKELHRKFPEAEITWIVNHHYVELLELCPFIDKIIPFYRNRWSCLWKIVQTFKEFTTFIKTIQNQQFDIAIDLQGLFRSGLIAYLSKANVRIGFKNAREGALLFYNYRVKVPKDRQHAIARYLTLIEHLGYDYNELIANPFENILNLRDVQHKTFDISPHQFSKEVSSCSLTSHNLENWCGDIVIGPGSRWVTKQWPAYKFLQLIEKLHERFNVKIALIGDKNDFTVAEEIVKGTNLLVANLTGKTSLVQLASILNQCKVFITNDSGPMHLAYALGKPVVALFGPTDPKLTGPWGVQNMIIQSNLFCSPCFKRSCRDIQCMEKITVEEVYHAVEEILKKNTGMI